VLVLIALLLPIVLILVGFSIDLANMQRVRTELRAATDLSSKAAAHALSVAPMSSPGQGRQAAIDAANAVAGANTVGGEPLQLATSDFIFGQSVRQSSGEWVFTTGGARPNAVRVVGRRTAGSGNGSVPLNFGLLYGRATFEPVATATSSFRAVDICLVLDRSSSMKLAVSDTSGLMGSGDPRQCAAPYSDSRWIALDVAVNVFVDQLEASSANEKLALATFGGGGFNPCGNSEPAVVRDQGLSTNMTDIRAAMTARSNSVWNGMTNIEAGIQEATTILTTGFARVNAEKVMIVFTDGVYTENDPVPAAQNAHSNHDIIVHTITFSAGANQSDMDAVSYAGGGGTHHAPDSQTLTDIFSALAGSIAIMTE